MESLLLALAQKFTFYVLLQELRRTEGARFPEGLTLQSTEPQLTNCLSGLAPESDSIPREQLRLH